MEYGFRRDGEEDTGDSSRSVKRPREPEIVVAQDENHNSVGVQKWHFPTIEEVEEREDQ